jgi:hypothetical protein
MFPWWWTAPTYSQCRDGFVSKFCALARSAGVLKDATTSVPLQATLTNGVRIEARSWDRPEGMYGPTILGGAVDEFGQLTEAGYGAISSRRAESVSWGMGLLRYAGNAGDHDGIAENLWLQAERGDPGFAARRWTWRDRAKAHNCSCGIEDIHYNLASGHNSLCPRGAYLQHISNEASRMSDPQFRQLYEAEWVDWNDVPAYLFDRHIHINDKLARYQGGLPIDLSCDFNVDPMAWVLGQHRNKRAWAFDEIIIPGGATTDMACTEFMRRITDRSQEVVVYGDRSGNSRDTKSKTTDYEIIRKRLGSFYRNFRMDVQAANPPVAERLNCFNGKLTPTTGEAMYHVHSRCKALANDLARVSCRPGTREIDKSNKKLTHPSDADGYRIARLFPVYADPIIVTGTGPSWSQEESIQDMEF